MALLEFASEAVGAALGALADGVAGLLEEAGGAGGAAGRVHQDLLGRAGSAEGGRLAAGQAGGVAGLTNT